VYIGVSLTYNKGVARELSPNYPILAHTLASLFSRQPRLATDGQQRLATPINLPCQPLQPIRPTRPSRVVLVATSDTLTGHAPRPRFLWQNATSARGLWGGGQWRGVRKRGWLTRRPVSEAINVINNKETNVELQCQRLSLGHRTRWRM